MNKKKNMYQLDIEGAVKDVDFIIISDTPFNEEYVESFYGFYDEHNINEEIAEILGFGIAKIENDFYLYNAYPEENRALKMLNELLKVAVYYQITHPEYDDKELEKIIFNDKELGKSVLSGFQRIEGNELFNMLEEVFKRKKGNVVQFPALIVKGHH